VLSTIGLPTAFGGRSRPRRIHQNPSHDPRAHRKEMRSVGPTQVWVSTRRTNASFTSAVACKV
jgi:hypothetical protein